jgi:hypothetical protein
MAIRLSKPWKDLNAENIGRLPGQLGVYEIADASGTVIRTGYAGGRSLFGLRGELERELRERPEPGLLFRVEVNQQYMTRYKELLMAHVADHGRLPSGNSDDVTRLGRISG